MHQTPLPARAATAVALAVLLLASSAAKAADPSRPALAADPSRAAHADDPLRPHAADRAWTASVVEEDDYYAANNRDRHYTHGIMFSAVSGDVLDAGWAAPFRWMPLFPDDPSAVRRYQILGGQNMYTPQNTATANPDLRDRPYAGWLYGGFALMQDSGGNQFDRMAVRLGVIGPSSWAGQVQTRFHILIETSRPNGWHTQLRDEPTLDLYRERKWRAHAALGGGFGVEAIPQVGLRLGNVYDYVSAGGLLRVGRNLKVDYGPPKIDENLGADYVNPAMAEDGEWAWYGFVGTEGRVVGRNIFLDGNSFERSRSVPKNVAVADLQAGAALLWGHMRLGYTYVYRTPEFSGQSRGDHYGSLNLTVRVPF